MTDSLSYDLALLNVGYAIHYGDWNFGPICSNISRIYYVTKGQANVIINHTNYSLSPGHLYLIPSLTTHYDTCNDLFEHYYIHFIDCSQSIQNLFQRYILPFELKASPSDVAIIKRLIETYTSTPLRSPIPWSYETSNSILESTQQFKTTPIGKRMEVTGLLTTLLSRFFSHASLRDQVNDNRIEKALWMIEKHLNTTLTIDELAHEVSLCKNRFIRLFHEQTHMTPTQYIIHRKIFAAQKTFISSKKSVKEVAYEVGYNDVSYFGRLFKKVTGVSPLNFIKQNSVLY